MSTDARSDETFRALLRFWRGQRGMSQLDLGLTADVSARHISFLETGRSRPSVEMVSLLAEVLDVPLRSRNELLRAAGFEAHYAEPSLDELLEGPLGGAVQTMFDHHEPFPLMIFNRWYQVVRANEGGRRLLALAGADASQQVDLLAILFDENLRPMLKNWDDVASQMLRSVQRDVLKHPDDAELARLLERLLESPGVPEAWRTPDLSKPSDPIVSMEIDLGDVQLRLLATLTVFHSPNNVTLDELHIESYLPLDDATREFFT